MMQKQLQRLRFFPATVPAGSSRSIQGLFFFLGSCEVGGWAILLKRNEPNAKFGQRSAERTVKRIKNPAKLFWQRPGTHCLDLVTLAPFFFPKKYPLYILSTGFGQRSERKVKNNLRIQLCFGKPPRTYCQILVTLTHFSPKRKKPLWILGTGFSFLSPRCKQNFAKREREKKKERNIDCKHRRS